MGIGLESKTSQLIDYLRPRKMLLVMDNFEHLVTAAELLGELVAAAPGLNILVTSRQRLNLPGEWVLPVGSLQIPNGAAAQPLKSFSAANLFIQCARRAEVGFKLSQDERRWVARICQLVDGVPLAIELAASWVKMLSCQEIAGEIQRSLDFLAAQRGLPGPPSQPESRIHAFLGATLRTGEARVHRLAVFHGPFQRQAAEAVLSNRPPSQTDLVGATGPAASIPILGLLAALVDKSLLRRGADGHYEMHELLKQYAAEMLEKDPQELKLTRDQHATYYQAALDNLAADLMGAGLLPALRWIEGEFEDIRAAWRWSLSQAKLSSVVRMGNLLLAVLHYQ